MAEVAGVLLDEMREDPPQVDLRAVAQADDGSVEVRPAGEGCAGGVELPLVRLDVGCRGPGGGPLEVTVRVVRVDQWLGTSCPCSTVRSQ